MFLSRQTPWIAYESSIVASGYRAVIRGITPCVRSASASSWAIPAIDLAAQHPSPLPPSVVCPCARLHERTFREPRKVHM